MMGPDGWRGVIAASDPLSEQLEDLQFVCGEGPCIHAFTSGHRVLVDDLEDRVWADWIGYVRLAQQVGVHADIAMSTLVPHQESESSGRSAELEEALDVRPYQAQGMVSAQLGVDLVEAMARIRAFALAHDRRLNEVAVAVLDGVLHLGEKRRTPMRQIAETRWALGRPRSGSARNAAIPKTIMIAAATSNITLSVCSGWYTLAQARSASRLPLPSMAGPHEMISPWS